jgi:hypothetical protein
MPGQIIVESHCKFENKRIIGIDRGIPQIKISISHLNKFMGLMYTHFGENLEI